MEDKIPILKNYKEGSRTGNIAMLKEKENLYNILIDWDDPRFESITLFSGRFEQCVDYSKHRFGIKEKNLNRIK